MWIADVTRSQRSPGLARASKLARKAFSNVLFACESIMTRPGAKFCFRSNSSSALSHPLKIILASGDICRMRIASRVLDMCPPSTTIPATSPTLPMLVGGKRCSNLFCKFVTRNSDFAIDKYSVHRISSDIVIRWPVMRLPLLIATNAALLKKYFNGLLNYLCA
jgi:hypothetical protein